MYIRKLYSFFAAVWLQSYIWLVSTVRVMDFMDPGKRSFAFAYNMQSTMCVNTLQWRHNEHDGVSNHQCLVCLFSRLLNQHQRNQSQCYWPFVGGIHQWQVDSAHKGPVMRKPFSFDDVIMGRIRKMAISSLNESIQCVRCRWGLLRVF